MLIFLGYLITSNEIILVGLGMQRLLENQSVQTKNANYSKPLGSGTLPDLTLISHQHPSSFLSDSFISLSFINNGKEVFYFVNFSSC